MHLLQSDRPAAGVPAMRVQLSSSSGNAAGRGSDPVDRPRQLSSTARM
ncbi:protein of unassigned function [Methylobacterium oryzae CBMB20]|uniref:Protein of unassigned function n=1 Tax=Methylobacterium oryzae CBMB20 TaxID=693986 RepID=A0A089NYP9_9HYPH|nr:protein of unassigned function [Methylobacterium oryzae CBMB20]